MPPQSAPYPIASCVDIVPSESCAMKKIGESTTNVIAKRPIPGIDSQRVKRGPGCLAMPVRYPAMAPLVGITSVPRIIKTLYDPAAAAQTATQAIIDQVVAAGGIPVILPVVAPEAAARQLAALDALVLAGGQDVDPTSYGRPPAAEDAWIAPDRDAHELALLAGARERGLPVLGICRGLQLANVALGGDLVEHVAGHDRVAHESHAVQITPGTLLHDATGCDEIAVNTLHHQTVGTLAPGLVRSAIAQDGVPEAAEATDGPWLVAVQWHPELMGDAPGGRDLFAALVAHA